MVKCSVKCCSRNARSDIGVSFFRFPAESLRCDEWLRALGRPDLQGIHPDKMHHSKYRICSVHFHNNSFSSMLMNRLKKEAVPILFPYAAGPGPFFDYVGLEGPKLSGTDMARGALESNGGGASMVEKMATDEPSETNLKEVEALDSQEKLDEDPLKIPDNVIEESSDNLKNSNNSQDKLMENGIEENSNLTNNKEYENEADTEKHSGSILSATLSAPNEECDEDDDYFNPLLLCPDISMDVDESPVVTTPAEPEMPPNNNDMMDSNALFAPLFSTFVDEMTGAEISFNLTAEEQQLREKLYGPNNPIEYSKVHCTACNVHLGSALAGQTNRFVHPLLKVLICKECYHFYTSGEFEKDEDGSELYCRWCGQGGQVLCCSKCEFVFCKKCIRINFGRKKLTEVRDSDEWNCFRCDMSQLKALRAMCVEFFEYVRRETARAATLNDPNFINKDMTNCCQTQLKKRLGEPEIEVEKEVKRPKRTKKNEEEDPDYNPFAQQDPEKPPSPVPSTSGVNTSMNATKSLPLILPKPVVNEVNFPGQSPSPTVRIGNTVLNVKSTLPTTPAPQAKNTPVVSRVLNSAIRSPAPSVVSAKSRTTFTPRAPTQVVTPRPPTVTSVVGSMGQARSTISRMSNNTSAMKHEWFEKTVRAAARVNSNLSYTLTQLNKAQASASSVEQLAVVHNKLQEILSSSINSLIQIRKNLRTEFIAGIKTIRFPPKPPIDPNDDDVIIVNSTGPDIPQMSKTLPQISIKKTARSSSTPNKVVSENNLSITSPSNITPSRGYLKVKSFSQLQTVTSECITIPDDDPPRNEKDDELMILNQNLAPEMEKDPLADDPTPEDRDKNSESNETVPIMIENVNDKGKNTTKTTGKRKDAAKVTVDEGENKTDKNEINKKEDTNNQNDKQDLKNTNEKDQSYAIEEERSKKSGNEEKENNTNKKQCVAKENGGDENDKNKRGRSDQKKGTKDNTEKEKVPNGTPNTDDVVQIKLEPEDSASYNIKEKPSPKIRRMLSVKVNLKKTPVVENLVKKEPIENGGD